MTQPMFYEELENLGFGYLNTSNSVLHLEELPTAETYELDIFINPATIHHHQTPEPSIIDDSPAPESPTSIPRNLGCPFYASNPSKHPKCKDKKFPYMCRVREHISTHTRPFRCKRCHRRFSSNFGVNRHKDTCSHYHGGDVKKGSRGPREGPGGGGDVGKSLHEKLMVTACVDEMVRILADMGMVESVE
ncbi:hypothetical protein K440DRAFT_657095 [Wilcoxina mikolae CBS 423.85]|nr:hypothetical protein K440DRAFT_657095 [Wilcoxina mikolae CBS 423.85]